MTQLLIKELKMQLPRKLIILLIKFSPYINLIEQSMKINNWNHNDIKKPPTKVFPLFFDSQYRQDVSVCPIISLFSMRCCKEGKKRNF